MFFDVLGITAAYTQYITPLLLLLSPESLPSFYNCAFGGNSVYDAERVW